jgi:hypothetical protein
MPRPRSTSATYRFLKRHQASPETDPGSVSLRCLFGGNYVVPPSKYDTFMELYAGDAGEYALGLVEVKRDGSFPFVLDVDFPEDHPGDRWRQVHDILRNMQIIIGGVRGGDEDDHDFVFREAQIAHRRGLKFHVVFPGIVTTSAWAVRLTHWIRAFMRVDDPSVDWAKVLDDSVAKSNGLRMLGSFKRAVEDGFYVPCRVLDWDSMAVEDLPITVDALRAHSVRLLTRGDEDALVLDDQAMDHEQVAAIDAGIRALEGAPGSSPMVDAGDGSSAGPRARVPLECLRRAVMALPEAYYGKGSYSEWSRVVWTLHHIGQDNGYLDAANDLAHEFSRQAGPIAYDGNALDRMWQKAHVRAGGARLGWSSLLAKVRLHDPSLATELAGQVSSPPQAENSLDNQVWDRDQLADALRNLLATEDALEFSFDPQNIQFKSEAIDGRVRKSDLAVFVADDFKGYLETRFKIPDSLSLLHASIPETMQWTLEFGQDQAVFVNDAEAAGQLQASVNWHHPYEDGQYLTVNVAGMRRGAAVRSRSTLEYVEGRVRAAIQDFLQSRYGITNCFFQNCTFNINIDQSGGENERHRDDHLVDFAVAARPQLLERFRFCPDAKSANTTGFFACDPDTNLWSQKHVNVVEQAITEALDSGSVQGLSRSDVRFIGSRRGKGDLRHLFATKVIDETFLDRLNANLDVFACANGLVDMNTKEFRDIRPEDCISLHTGWEYSQEDARVHRPALEAFLEKLLPLPEERRVVLTYIAGLLSGRRVIKKLLVLTDRRAGSNGKSTLVGLCKAFFGGYSKLNNRFFNRGTFERDRDSHDAGLDPFAGYRLTILEEMKRSTKIDEGLVKWLTGGAGVVVAGRKLGSAECFRFTWQSGFIMVFNEGDAPTMDITDEAFVGRLLVAPMRSKFVQGVPPQDESYTYQADAGIDKKFKLWRSAMLDVLLDHYQTDNLGPQDIPQSMNEWRAEIVEERNMLGNWLEKVIQKSDDPNDFLRLADLKDVFEAAGNNLNLPRGEFTRMAKCWFTTRGFVYRDSDQIRLADGTRKGERNIVRGAILK